MTLRERFYAKVSKSDGCWEWQGQEASGGYGRFEEEHQGKVFRMRAHRLSYALEHGPIPKGKIVCHHCDNPICVRPDHLFLGTHRDNTRDMMSKGRGNAAPPGTLIPGGTGAKNAAKEACPKCGGPLIVVKWKSQGGRRRCPPCTKAHQAKYMKEWKKRKALGKIE